MKPRPPVFTHTPLVILTAVLLAALTLGYSAATWSDSMRADLKLAFGSLDVYFPGRGYVAVQGTPETTKDVTVSLVQGTSEGYDNPLYETVSVTIDKLYPRAWLTVTTPIVNGGTLSARLTGIPVVLVSITASDLSTETLPVSYTVWLGNTPFLTVDLGVIPIDKVYEMYGAGNTFRVGDCIVNVISVNGRLSLQVTAYNAEPGAVINVGFDPQTGLECSVEENYIPTPPMVPAGSQEDLTIAVSVGDSTTPSMGEGTSVRLTFSMLFGPPG